MHGTVAMVKPRPLTAGKIKHLARQAELESKTGASGYTLLRIGKHSTKPIAHLVESKSIGPEELAAAHDISTAFLSIAGALMVRGQTWERVDKGQDCREPAAVIDAQHRYKNFAVHWSMRRGWGDRTLEILVRAVIDEQPLYLIDADLNLRHGKARKATIRGLRDYAVRAGWVKGRLAEQWKAEAGCTFTRWPAELAAAVARAKR
jgi:hypothetical protein